MVDPGNQQIYLPAFPHSTPVVNLNLTNFPGRPGGSEIKGENSLDMCLYDGNNSTSTRAFLRFEDDGLDATGRAEGAFSIRRRGGSQTDPRDRLDYQVLVTNPTTGATEVAANGKTLTGRVPTIAAICVRLCCRAAAKACYASRPPLS